MDIAFKLPVTQIVQAQGLSIGEVFRDQNLVDSAVRRGLAQYSVEQSGQVVIGQWLKPEQ